VIRLLLILVLAGGSMFAQRPRGFYPWWDRPVARDMNLRPAQQRQIRSTVREYRGKLMDARAALERAETEFQDAMKMENIDERRAEAAVENLAQARASLTRAFSRMSLQLRLVLTSEQWKELEKRRPSGDPAEK